MASQKSGKMLKQFRARAVEVVFDEHIDGAKILEAYRERKYRLYKGFVKWHNGADGQKPHTHVGLILAEKPRLEIKEQKFYEYFKVGAVGPKLVNALGRGNTSPVKKLTTYVDYLVDGHDNGRYKDTWNYKFDHELEACKDWSVKAFVLLKRGQTFEEIFWAADNNGQCALLDAKKRILKRWQTYETMLEKKKAKPELRPAQVEIEKQIDEQGDRKVLWVVDREGDKGKTWMLKYLAQYRGACVMNNAKKADIACHYNGEDIVGMNLTRTVTDRVNYEAIEMLKDGLVFDGKYESSCYVRPFGKKPVKVVVMSNEEPDYSAMSQDRWHIMTI